MAKRSTTTTESHYSLVKFLSFIGLAFAALAFTFSVTLKALSWIGVEIRWGEKAEGYCRLIEMVALFISVWLAAWDYVKFKRKVWRVFYIVFLIISIVGLVIGFIPW